MSLTLGTGPFAGSDAGAVNFAWDGAPAHRILFEPYGRRLRAVVNGHTILDSTAAHLLHETGIPPVAYVPLGDLDDGLLERTPTSTHCPFKGDASYWTLRAGDRTVEDFVWAYEEPLPEAAWLEGFAALYWKQVDELYVEDERALGSVRDPYHRVDVLESSRHVTVSVDGSIIAESSHPKLMFETGLAPRAYVPPTVLPPGSLVRSETRTLCPYKGEATYWHLQLPSGLRLEDAAWSYETPLPEALKAQGHLGFGDAVEIDISG